MTQLMTYKTHTFTLQKLIVIFHIFLIFLSGIRTKHTRDSISQRFQCDFTQPHALYVYLFLWLYKWLTTLTVRKVACFARYPLIAICLVIGFVPFSRLRLVCSIDLCRHRVDLLCAVFIAQSTLCRLPLFRTAQSRRHLCFAQFILLWYEPQTEDLETFVKKTAVNTFFAALVRKICYCLRKRFKLDQFFEN